jgi:hypothetical protein
MSKTLQWIIGLAVILIVASIIFSTVMPFFFPRTGGYGMMGPGMMGGYGMGMPFFGWGMMTMLLWPVLFIGLIVLGVVWLVRSLATPAAPPPPAAVVHCAHCGQPLQPGWKACPYCGEKVATG